MREKKKERRERERRKGKEGGKKKSQIIGQTDAGSGFGFTWGVGQRSGRRRGILDASRLDVDNSRLTFLSGKETPPTPPSPPAAHTTAKKGPTESATVGQCQTFSTTTRWRRTRQPDRNGLVRSMAGRSTFEGAVFVAAAAAAQTRSSAVGCFFFVFLFQAFEL